MANAPCKDCPDRKMGCHGRCEKYLAFRAVQTEESERKHMIAVSTKSDKTWFEREWRKKVRYHR